MPKRTDRRPGAAVVAADHAVPVTAPSSPASRARRIDWDDIDAHRVRVEPVAPLHPR